VPQGDKRPKEVASRTDSKADAKPGETCENRTSSRPSCVAHHEIGGGEEEHGKYIGRMHNHGLVVDHNAKSISAHRKGHTSTNTRKGTCGQVPQSNKDCQGSVQCLGGSR
jgi:hypothetical protein